jgi:hypothetical protein
MADLKGAKMVMTGNTGDHSGTAPKVLDKAAIEDPNLVSSVEDRLANLNSITKESPKRSAEPDDDQNKSTPDDQDDQQADDQDKSSDTTPDDKGDDRDADKDVLPPAYLRAAVHRGWKEEDAKEFFEKSPEAALKTFQNCYMDINNASREWARIGKAKVKSDEIANAPEPKPEVKFEGVDVKKLKEEYDLDDKTVAMLEAQNQQLEAVFKQQQRQPEPVQTLPPHQQVQRSIQSGPDPNVELQVENFFKSEDLKLYSDFYGELKIGQDWSELNPGQYKNRWRVLEQAELMLLGADAQNYQMDPLDALERAHMLVSESVREEVIRNDIKNTATKRKNSMTIKPSDGSRSQAKVDSDAGGERKPRTREELLEQTQDKLQKVFG